MYDPLVVDTFARVYREIAPDPLPAGDTRRALEVITSSTTQTASLTAPSRKPNKPTDVEEVVGLFEAAQALSGLSSTGDTCRVIAQHLQRLVPSALCVFFSYNGGLDELEARYAFGEGGALIVGLRIELGHRLSGWVAANRRTILNSDPVLDLGELARPMGVPMLKSALSTPLVTNDELVGVITLYENRAEAFDEDDRRVIEAIAGHIAYSFKRARDFDKHSRVQPLMASQAEEALSLRTGRS
jgi:GAF domain-containing protein